MRARLLSPPLLILSSTLSLIACDTPAIDQPIPTIVPSETPAATASPDLTLTAAPYYTPIISATRTPLATATALPADFTPDTPAPVPAIDIPAEPETAVAYYPPDTRVDVPVLDAIIQAVTTHDAERLQDLIHFSSMGCTHTLGMGGPPKCLEEEAEGTLVEGLPVLAAEGWYWRREEVDTIVRSILADQPPHLYAVYRQTHETITDSHWLPAQYGIVFANPSGYLHALMVDDVGVVRLYSSGESPDDLARFFSGEYILPPGE